MADERTYGFNRDDAQSLVQSISSGESIFPEIRPRGGGVRSGGSILFFTITEIDCPTEYEPEATGYWYVTPTYYSGGCGTIPGLVDDPYSDYDGLIEVRPPLCALGGATTQAADLIGATAKAYYMFPVGDCGNGMWIAEDPCVNAGC